MPLFSRAHVRLSRLRFPFAVCVQAEQGSACLRDTNGRREVHPGDPFVVPAFAHFGCDLLGTPRQPSAVTLAAVPDANCPRMAAIHHDKPWSRALANLIFEHPAQAWNAAMLSERWQMDTRLTRSRLFAEGEALRALVREQRAARALYAMSLLEADAMSPGDAPDATEAMNTIARQTGLRSIDILNATCANLFGVELAQVAPFDTGSVGAAAWIGWRSPQELQA